MNTPKTLPSFDLPHIGPRQGKVWGVTQLLFAHHGVECHFIDVKEGGFSSRHRHHSKWNRFVVIQGCLEVRIYTSIECMGAGDTKYEYDEIRLSDGDITDVPPGMWHEFHALEDTKAIEMYWVVLDAGDIDRGGNKGGTGHGS